MVLGRLKQAGRRGQQKTREKQGNTPQPRGQYRQIREHIAIKYIAFDPLNHQIMGYLLDSEHMHENHGKIAPKRRTGKEKEKQHQGMPNTGNR